MPVTLGCIKTLADAIAYINAEIPYLKTYKGTGCANGIALAAQALTLATTWSAQGLNSDAGSVVAVKNSILAYQNACRSQYGLTEKVMPACGSTADKTSAVTANVPITAPTVVIGGGSGGASAGGGGGANVVITPNGSGGGSTWPWLLGLAVGGLIFFGAKKGVAKSKAKRRAKKGR